MDSELASVVFIESFFKLLPSKEFKFRSNNIVDRLRRRIINIGILIDERTAISSNIISKYVNLVGGNCCLEFPKKMNCDVSQFINRVEVSEMEGAVGIRPKAIDMRLICELFLNSSPNGAIFFEGIEIKSRVLVQLNFYLPSRRNIEAVLKRNLHGLAIILNEQPPIVVVQCLELNIENSPKNRRIGRWKSPTDNLIFIGVYDYVSVSFVIRVRTCP